MKQLKTAIDRFFTDNDRCAADTEHGTERRVGYMSVRQGNQNQTVTQKDRMDRYAVLMADAFGAARPVSAAVLRGIE